MTDEQLKEAIQNGVYERIANINWPKSARVSHFRGEDNVPLWFVFNSVCDEIVDEVYKEIKEVYAY